ncbi:PIN domain-containing protein [Aquiflexum lacus]|uniref:PIN domain-containing protein n=1 Tax=Aquiflexum lacus TaxID=2483805 RepID=UPI001894F28B
MNRIALDTNVLMYLYDSSDEKKRRISESLLASTPSVSTQVVSEFLNVTRRLQKMPKNEVLEKCNKVLSYCKIIPVSYLTLDKALYLINRYDFQLFDSIIISSALEASCSTLYSEDLQHNQLIENRLTIINPFV